MIRKLLLIVSLVSLVFLLSCQKDNQGESIRLSGNVFGTTYSMVYRNDNHNYQKEIDSLFNRINLSLSKYIENSLISRINQGDTTVVVDQYLEEVFNKSKRIYEETSGYFDPTLGALVNAWGFGPQKAITDLDSTQVKELLQYVGFDKVTLEDGKIIKENPNINLDFNAIAKGYGIDVIGRFLESKNCKNYLVEIGGEVRVRGVNDKGQPWRIGLDNPNTDGTRTIGDFVDLNNESIASSGNYRKYRIGENGMKYVHTINPRTGFATESNLLSATVISDDDCADVDAYATAFMAMGYEKTVEFLKNRKDLKVVLNFINDKGDFVKYTN